jgi:ArsR family transcriptional regulator
LPSCDLVTIMFQKALKTFMEKMTRAAQALSDETRLRILNALTVKECCVCEMMQALEISQTRASRNLKILNDAGFLNMRTEGLYTLYSLVDGKTASFQADLLAVVRKELAANKRARQDAARLEKAKRVGPGCGPQKQPFRDAAANSA